VKPEYGVRIAACIACISGAAAAQEIVCTVTDTVIDSISSRIFGGFLERPSWGGERGIEAAWDTATGSLRDDIREKLHMMNLPSLRFPGGTDVDHMDWTDMIDNAPGRDGDTRPRSTGHTGQSVANHFGIDEFLALCEELETEPMLVVNLGDAVWGKKPVREAARHAAGLVAYCNAMPGDSLPEGMPDYGALRARNGHPEPYAVRVFQIGNEWRLKDRGGDEWYFACVDSFTAAMRAVDPDIELIADAPGMDQLLEYRAFKGSLDYAAVHYYAPWAITRVVCDGEEIAEDAVSGELVWNAWVAPTSFNKAGQSIIDDPAPFAAAQMIGGKAAITEWNWNGWWDGVDGPEPTLAQGLGAAGFIHAMMRMGSILGMAHQSMVVGESWRITAIRIERDGSRFLPTGRALMFYAAHHGNLLLSYTAAGSGVYEQPCSMSFIKPARAIAYVDIVVTADERRLYVHAINRDYARDRSLAVAFDGFSRIGSGAVHHLLRGVEGESLTEAEIIHQVAGASGDTVRVVLPKRSVSCLEIEVADLGNSNGMKPRRESRAHPPTMSSEVDWYNAAGARVCPRRPGAARRAGPVAAGVYFKESPTEGAAIRATPR
jgi:alpha-N-arabinofuranosidase